MKQVLKYEVDANERPIVIPVDAEILSAAFQDDKLMIWALVDPNEELTRRKILVRGTGHNIGTSNIVHIDTAFMGVLVFHVFEDLSYNYTRAL